MAYRANPANPRHERGHFVKRTAFAELFKSAKLRDMKARGFHFSPVVHQQRNLCVALEPRNRIDDNRSRHLFSSSSS
jgi:hypothetical protein